MSGVYNTKPKSKVLKFLSTNKNKCFTVKEIEKCLLNQNDKVGSVTIYRYLNELVNKGLVSKSFDDKINTSIYQYLEFDNIHYHLRCYKCGNITHLNCDSLDTLIIHLEAYHQFKIDNAKFIINGICNNCCILK